MSNRRIIFFKERKREAARGFKRFLLSKKRRRKLYMPVIHLKKFHQNKLSSSLSKLKRKSKTIECPPVFSVEKNLKGVIEILGKIRNIDILKYNHVKIDLSKVVDLDITALVMLLSNINHLAQEEIVISGNTPNDIMARTFFEDSGFLKHMKTINKRLDGSYSDHGLIINIGKDNYFSNQIAEINSKAVELLGASRQYFQRLNSIVGEMGGNTIKYAYKTNKHFLYGFYLHKDYMTFVFADSGYGILNTLKKTIGHIIFDKIKNIGDVGVLSGAFDKKYGSRTGEENRNRGLPFIKYNFTEGIISELQCITNNVVLDFEDYSKSIKLKDNFSGTVYVWKINRK